LYVFNVLPDLHFVQDPAANLLLAQYNEFGLHILSSQCEPLGHQQDVLLLAPTEIDLGESQVLAQLAMAIKPAAISKIYFSWG
jgi:hypothetical protein